MHTTVLNMLFFLVIIIYYETELAHNLDHFLAQIILYLEVRTTPSNSKQVKRGIPHVAMPRGIMTATATTQLARY